MKKAFVLGVVVTLVYFWTQPGDELVLREIEPLPAMTLSSLNIPKLDLQIPSLTYEDIQTPKTAEQAQVAREKEEYHQRVLEEKPESAEAHAEYAVFLVFEGRVDEARREMSEAVRLDPNNKALAVYRKQVEEMATGERILPPLPDFTLAKLEDEIKPDSNAREIPKEEQEQQRQELLVRYGETTVYNASDSEVDRINIAQNYNVQKMPDAADEAFQKLLEEFPDSPLVRGKYAHFLLLHRNQVQEAREMLNEAVAQFPQDRYLNVMRDVFVEEQQRSPAKTPDATISIDISYRLMLLAME